MLESDSKSSAITGGQARTERLARSNWRGRFLRLLWLWQANGARYVLQRVWLRSGYKELTYCEWIKANDTLSIQDLSQIRKRINTLKRQPLISLVLFFNGTSADALRFTIESIRGQLYENWELYIAYTGAEETELKSILNMCADGDPRIKLGRTESFDFVRAGNAALAECLGEFVGLLKQNETLAPHALYLVLEEINICADAALIYADDDFIDDRACRSSPRFKTDWNPDLFLSQNYLGQVFYRRSLVTSYGFRSDAEGCEEFDLVLRVIEQTTPINIRHIPYVLVHRDLSTEAQVTATSVQNASRVLQEHLNRIEVHAVVEVAPDEKHFRVRRILQAPAPQVSIVIPTRDHVELVRNAVESIQNKTDYSNYEIVIVDNQSVAPDALAYLSELVEIPNIRVLRYDAPFNYSAINNFAAKQCQSQVLAFLNNDLLVINNDWLTEMVSQAMRPEVGAVGAMLYYPDDVIQHAGIILGFGGVAANCYSGLNRGSVGYLSRAKLLQNYSAVTAACILTRARVFAEVGGFDESNLPVAFNDVDYCLRLRERGYSVIWTPYAEMYHLESVSRGDDMAPSKIDRFRRDQAYMTKRWAHVLANDPFYSPNLSLHDVPFSLANAPRLHRPWKPNN